MTNATPNDNRQSARELWNSLREEPRTELERRGDLFHLYNEFLKDESDNWECSFCQGAVHNTEPDYVEIRWDETYKLWGIVVIDDHPVISGPLHDRAEVGYFPTVNEALHNITREMLLGISSHGSVYARLKHISLPLYTYKKNGDLSKQYVVDSRIAHHYYPMTGERWELGEKLSLLGGKYVIRIIDSKYNRKIDS